MKRVAFLLVAITILISCSNSTEAKDYKEIEKLVQSGDIIFQSTNSRQCQAIKLATKSEYSHCGIIFEDNGKFMVYEALQPVRVTPLEEWIERGEDGHYVIKRIKNAETVLTDSTLANMINIGDSYLGKNYDLYFEWSDDKIYCSELVWKIYNQATGLEIGNLKKLKDFDLSSRIVKSIMTERYGDAIPYDEDVISPAGMFASDLLILVDQN